MLTDKPHITIITVVYNGEQFLEQTIKSVLAQPYENLSYIIIDGGSTDKSVNIIKQYQEKLSYWVSEKDRGIYDAMNKGWAVAADDSFILFLGAGDRIISLPSMGDVLAAADVIYGKVYIGKEKCFHSKAGILLRFFNTLHHQALLVKKKAHPENPFDLRFTICADFDFNQRLLRKKVMFAYAADLIGYAMPGGVSDKFAYRESFGVIKKNFGLLWSVGFSMLYLASLLWGIVFRFKPYSAVRPQR